MLKQNLHSLKLSFFSLLLVTGLSSFFPSICFSALENCVVEKSSEGHWLIEDPDNLPTGNFSCIIGNYKYLYWDGHLGGFPSCEERINIYIPSQFPHGSASCGVDINPCGGIHGMDYFPSGENCCVERPGSKYVWSCYDNSGLPDTGKNFGQPNDC